MRSIDLNADVGEAAGATDALREPGADDGPLLDVVSSASIACGVHAGDTDTMVATLAAAASRGVTVGAHPSYDDRDGFGRRHVETSPAALTAGLVDQIDVLSGLAWDAGTVVSFVKPHGALYARMTTHEPTARAVLDALAAFDGLTLLAPAGSAALAAADRRGVPAVAEAFADRAYAPDGSLVPRGVAGAVINDPDEAARRAVSLAVDGRVEAVDGTMLTLSPASICVHGDTSGALAIAIQVRAALGGAGVALRPFVP